jgi:hypothetical protein
MPVIRLTGNTQFINAAANVIALANTYGANATSGATMLYIYNSNNSPQTLILANSEGSFSFTIPSNTVLEFDKLSTDTLQASSNTSNGCIYATPVAKSPEE